MSNVSPKLTRQLQFYAEWNDTRDILIKYKLSDEPLRIQNPLASGVDIKSVPGSEEWRLPCYDTDYLFRKMPLTKLVGKQMYFLGVIAAAEEIPSWVAGYYHFRPQDPMGRFVTIHSWNQMSALTPDDALAKLAIALYKNREIS